MTGLGIQHAVPSRWEAADSKRGAQPAAPDVIEKNQCDSKLRCWVQQLMHIVHPAVVCKSYVQSIWNTTEIDPKSKKRNPGHSESIQIRPCSTKSMPNRYEKLQKSIFKWFWRCTFEVKMWRKSPNLNENPNSISIACLHADFYQFSAIWGPQNVPKIKTFSKFV